MFYLFNVNQGCAQHLEVSAALGSVRNLQQVIEEITHIPAQEQVLLINGGEGLHPDRTVAYYQGCGTDSNPVFLFYKIPEGEKLNIVPPEYIEITKSCQELDKRLKVYESASLSTSLITRYIELAVAAYQITDNAYQLCNRIFQEHQFLYQGWLALMSNFEECRSQIQKRVEKFFQHCEKMKAMKNKAQTVVQDFDAALDLMERIKIPASLMEKSTEFEATRKFEGECSLYDFIAAADPKNSLRDVVNGISDSIAQMDDSACKEVKIHLETMHGRFSKSDWQEIGGINGRFQHLDKELRTLEQRAAQMKQFSMNISQTGYSSASIKDLVVKLRAQMVEVQKTLDYVYNTLKSFMGSKQEILHNIRERLSKLALKAYDRLHMLNNAVTVYEEKYVGLRNRLDIIRQVKESPIVYMMAVAETVRRSELQQEFMLWFTKFMERSQKLVREESSLRDAFTTKLEHHFLKQLFPGLFDSFPTFAPTQLPSFDQDLPPVDVTYISVLKQAIPSHAHLLKVNKPIIFNRLAIGEVQPVCSPSTTLANREESFTIPGSPAAGTAFSRQFPSSNWLSGDENVDLSPSNAVFFVKTPTSQLGSSLDLDIAESPSKALNSLPPNEVSLPRRESSADVRVAQSPRNLPVKFLTQRDSNIQHFEIHGLEQLTQKGASERLKAVLGDVKGFSETLVLLQQSHQDLRSIFDETMREIAENVAKHSAISVKDLQTGQENLGASNEEAYKELREKIEKQLLSEYEAKIINEVQKAKEQTENSCRVQFDIVLEAEVKAAREEAEKECTQKASENLQKEISKVKEDLEKEFTVRHEKFLNEMLEKTRMETEMEVVARSELKLQDELRKKEEEDAVKFAKEYGQKIKLVREETEKQCFLQFEKEFQEKLERMKTDFEKEHGIRFDEVLAKELAKVRDETELECQRKFDEKLLKEVEDATEVTKKDCSAKFAIKLKEELEKMKEQTEKDCVSQYKKKLQQELESEHAQLEEQYKVVNEERLRAEVEAAKAEIEKNCLAKCTEQAYLKSEEIEKETQRLLSQHKLELEEETARVRQEAEVEIAILKKTIENDKLELEKLRLIREEDKVLIETLKRKCDEVAVKVPGTEEDDNELLQISEDARGEKPLSSETAQKAEDAETGKPLQKANDEVRAALEKEYMALQNKMQLLIKGHEEKKAQEIARIRNEAEAEMRCKDYRIHELEQMVESLRLSGDTSEASGVLSLPNMSSMQESVMEVSACAVSPSHSKEGAYSEETKDGNKGDRDEEEERSEDDITSLAVNTRGAQTRLRLKDLRYMITVQDLRELSTVLIIFNEVHQAYLLFCLNTTLYFVKESCLRRLGLRSDQPAVGPRKNWLLGVLTRLEFCQIRKSNNRYKLAIGTRFYRVEVEPLLIESSTRRANDA